MTGADLFAGLAIELGTRVAPGSSRSVAWRALAEAARLARWQGLQIVLAVDGFDGLTTASDRMDLERLDELDPDPSSRLTVLRLGRPEPLDSSGWDRPTTAQDWSLTVRLQPLTPFGDGRLSGRQARSGGPSRADVHPSSDHSTACPFRRASPEGSTALPASPCWHRRFEGSKWSRLMSSRKQPASARRSRRRSRKTDRRTSRGLQGLVGSAVSLGSFPFLISNLRFLI